MKQTTLITLLLTVVINAWQLPINAQNRKSFQQMSLTQIGHFGMWRVERPSVPGHYHTAIDIHRPDSNYKASPVYPINNGTVISMRDDGAYAQIIISHGDTIWSVYEHISGIEVETGEIVDPQTVIARFMNSKELNRYGWHFDHIHLEIMKKKPYIRKGYPTQPHLKFGTYSLTCYSKEELNSNYFDPTLFYNRVWRNEKEN